MGNLFKVVTPEDSHIIILRIRNVALHGKSDFAESFLFAENQRNKSMRKTLPAIADFEDRRKVESQGVQVVSRSWK